MKSPWPTKKLGEVVEKLELKKAQTNSWPYIEIGDVDIENKSIILKDKKSIKGAIIAPADSVLVSRVRPTRGAIVYLDKDYVVSSAFSVIKPKLFESSSKFLFYWLGFSKDFIRYLQKKQKGSNYPSVRDNDILNFKIPLPPLKIQQKIVERLDAIKKAQELNDKQIELAEELFQSLLHQELKPQKDWKAMKLSETISEISDGNYSSKYPRQSDFVARGVPFVRANNIKKGTIIWDDMRYISKEKHHELKKGHLKIGDVVITTRGEIGNVAIVPEEFDDANMNAQLVRLHTNEKIILKEFLFYTFQTTQSKKQLLGLLSGSTLKQLPVKSLLKFKIPLPPLETQRKIVEKLSAVQEYKKKLLDQKQKLQELFESVLNKSFSRILEYR